jgi:hypothetical protein
MIQTKRRRKLSAVTGFLLIAFVLTCDSQLRFTSWYGVPLAIYVIGGLLLAVLALHAYRIRGQQPPGCCPACGYNLTGNTTGFCPECGHTTARSPTPDASTAE